MSNVHVCNLPIQDSTCLPRLPPNASAWKRLIRAFRKLIIVNPKSSDCKTYFRNKSVIMIEQRRHIRSRYNYMIHPFSTLNIIIQVLFFGLWITKMIISPAIDSGIVERNRIAHQIDEYFLVFAQRAIVCAFFFVGYVDKKSNEIVLNPRKVAWKYFKTYFICDVFATELLHVLMYGLLDTVTTRGVTYEKVLRLMDFIHVPCLYARLYTTLTYLDGILQMMRIHIKMRRAIYYVVKTYMILHLFSCTLYFVPQMIYLDHFPRTSWLVAAKIQPGSPSSARKRYGECLLMATCFFFGASGGNYNVVVTNEQICLSFICLFGRLYTLFLLADALRMFGIVGISESSYERKLAQLREYMISNHLPRSLRTRMLRYYEFKLQKRYFNETEILESLSDFLRNEIFLYSAKNLMVKSNVFKYLPNREIVELISMMKQETFAPGDIIYKADHKQENIYFISSGTVAMVSKSGVELCHLEDGDAFGLCQMLMGRELYTCVVIETTEIFMMGIYDFHRFLDDYPEAQDYLVLQTRERLATYKQLEETAKRKIDTCMVELRKGVLLEKRRRRTYAQ